MKSYLGKVVAGDSATNSITVELGDKISGVQIDAKVLIIPFDIYDKFLDPLLERRLLIQRLAKLDAISEIELDGFLMKSRNATIEAVKDIMENTHKVPCNENGETFTKTGDRNW